MAGRHDRHLNTSQHTFTASIPLYKRNSHTDLAVPETDDELDPESDAAYLRRHRASIDSDADDDPVAFPSGPSLFQRLRTFIMSRNPLLIRSSPALGTGSYGAVPITNSHPGSYSSAEEDNSEDDVRKRDRRRDTRASSAHIAHAPSTATLRKTASAPREARRRTSSGEVVLGPDGKASFGGGGALPGRAMFDSAGESSNASIDSEDEDDFKADDPDPIDNSPYAQVRASVPATDNTTLSISTPRMWVLSLIFALAGSATNLFFSLRYPSVAITPVIALVLVHPLGKLWDFLLKRDGDPEEVFVDGRRQGTAATDDAPQRSMSRFRRWLAQGRWNEKEHACVYISSNVSFGFAFATDVSLRSICLATVADVNRSSLSNINSTIRKYHCCIRSFSPFLHRSLVMPSQDSLDNTLFDLRQ